MNTRTLIPLAALTLAVFTLEARAQRDNSDRTPRRARPDFPQGGLAARPERPDGAVAGRPLPLLRQLDANHDRVIDATEMAAAPDVLRQLDTDGNGVITLAELRAGRRGPGRQKNTERPGAGPAVPPLLAALDANGDGTLDAAEIVLAPAALARLDTNGDGTLTPEELHAGGRGHGRPGRPEGARGPEGRGPGPRGEGRPAR